MMNFKTTLALLLFGCSTALQAQSTDTTGQKISRPFQLTFISPIGTNGLESGRVINNVSMNLFAGYSGGVNGVEFGGFANIVKGDVDGVQFAGFGNSVWGTTKGGQFSGFYNVNKGYTMGAQFAGFINVVGDSANAIQMAGFSNVTMGNHKGLQCSGFNNTTSGDLEGGQIAGFVNTTTGDVDGAQIAGFANVADDVTGTQISGFVNVAKTLHGSQLGVFNYCDSVANGTPVGFLSFVRHGYHRFELGGNEVLWANASFKTGTERFYNIISTGVNLSNDKVNWAVGYGIGTLVPINNRLKLSVDAVAHQINEGNWTDDLHMLNRLNVSADYAITDKLSVFGGPAFNVMVSRIDATEGNGYTYSELAPYSFFDNTNSNDVNVKMWIGFSGGLRF